MECRRPDVRPSAFCEAGGGIAVRVFDVHVHFGWWEKLGQRDSGDGWLEELAAAASEAGIVKVALIGWPGWGNELVAKALEKLPDLLVGLAMVNLDEDSPKVVQEYYHQGFTGLKLINPARNYDDPAYFRFYERAEALGMPILFHTGVIGGPVDYLVGGDEDAWKAIPQGEAEERLVEDLRNKARLAPYGRSSARMQPIHLDTIATYFPKLYMIGAHLGWPDYMTACAVARWRLRLFLIFPAEMLCSGIFSREAISSGRSVQRSSYTDPTAICAA